VGFGHEKLDVYRAAIEYVGWAYRFCEGLKGHRNAKDQLLSASQAIPMPIPTPTPTMNGRIANHSPEATFNSPRLRHGLVIRQGRMLPAFSCVRDGSYSLPLEGRAPSRPKPLSSNRSLFELHRRLKFAQSPVDQQKKPPGGFPGG